MGEEKCSTTIAFEPSDQGVRLLVRTLSSISEKGYQSEVGSLVQFLRCPNESCDILFAYQSGRLYFCVPMRGVKKNTKKIIASFFVSVLVFQGVFAFAGSVQAQASQSQVRAVDNQIQANANAAASATPTVTGGEIPDSGCGLTNIGGCLKQMFIWLLLQVRNFIYLIIASPAAAAFVWAVNPANVSGPQGVLNLPAVYQLWQFIRDFFNLFFILILLFSAFATIFQVDSFNIRNIFKNVLLVALLINFSFPITRFLIDAANVPMYYFINDVIGNGTGRGGMIAMNNMLAHSGISAGTMTTTGENNNIVPVLMSIVFAFLFGISLAVLAVMMIIRLVALTLLLIFSPIGFAGALLPGFSKYGQEWWSKFWSYALFGPAAALMLVVALKFLEASGSLFRSMQMVGTDITPGTGEATVVSQVIFFTIPIMLIWFTIGLANKFSIAGAAAVVGMGMWAPKKIQEYSKKAMVSTAKYTGSKAWSGTKATAGAATRVVLPVDRMKGTYAGVKEAVKGDGKLFGRQVIPKFATGDGAQARKDARETRQRSTQGWVQGGAQGASDELRKLEIERVKKGVKEAQEKGTLPEKHLKTLSEGGSSLVEKRVAALSLAQQGEIRTAGQLADALDAVKGNVDEFNQVLDKAKPEAIGSMGAAENNRITTMLNDPAYGNRQRNLQEAYNARLKKEGKVEYRVEAELARAKNAGPLSPDQVSKVYADNLKMGANDLAKQSGIIQAAKSGGTDSNARAYFEKMATNDWTTFEKLLRSDDLKPEDARVLIEIQDTASTQRSAAATAQQGAETERRRRIFTNPNLDTSGMTHDGQPSTGSANSQGQTGPQA